MNWPMYIIIPYSMDAQFHLQFNFSTELSLYYVFLFSEIMTEF